MEVRLRKTTYAAKLDNEDTRLSADVFSIINKDAPWFTLPTIFSMYRSLRCGLGYLWSRWDLIHLKNF